MISVAIIGSGNVAHHLIKVISKSKNLEITQVFARNKDRLKGLIDPQKITSNLAQIKPADVVIICVTDGSVVAVSKEIAFNNQLVVHTAGSLNLDVLDSKNRKGVFYPLQTFSKDKEVDFSKVPLCIEAENEKDLQLLEVFAHELSSSVYKIDSQQRKALHVSAVFVSNFVNHLYTIGNAICQEHQIPFEILHPLIQETAQKIMHLSPVQAQTGPAIRHDDTITQMHEAFLLEENQKNIYKLLTQSIQDHVKKL
jgi:predicted short-subunit dehydrogenase-like oxidoreductase (DUF2520 family)